MLRRFWQHHALQHSLRCVVKHAGDHRASCSPATDDAKAGVYLPDGACLSGCGRLERHGKLGFHSFG